MRRVAAQSSGFRNVAVVGHGGSGKTTLAEGLLHLAGETARLGRVDEGTSILDADPDAIRRRISVSASVAPVPWNGIRINLIDTPGYLDFQGDVRAALRVADAALFVVDAVAGVEVGTELTWRICDELGLPRMVFVNKMDRENASFSRTAEQLRGSFGAGLLPLLLPIGAEASLRGAVDVLAEQALLFQARGAVGPAPVPEDLRPEAEAARAALIEAAAEADDDLLARYLDGETLATAEIRAALRKAVHAGRTVPVLCGAAGSLAGLRPLADAVVDLLPSPADRGPVRAEDSKTGQARECAPDPSAPPLALVWKTMADPYVGKLTIFRVYSGTIASDSQIYDATADATERVGQLYALCGKEQKPVQRVVAGDIGAVAKLQVTRTGDTLCDAAHPVRLAPPQFPRPVHVVAVEPKAKGDEDKISAALQRLQEEDPTLAVERNAETHQTLLSGLGELHLDVIMERLKRKFGVEVTAVPPRVPYRETIRGHGKAEGKHKKQTGGRGQYGHVFLEIDPLPRGQGFVFVDKIFGGAVPRQYIPAVEKGLRECMAEGVLAGYPVVDVQATLTDGSYHPVDSSEMAFKIAASLAFKKACQEAGPVLLEPIVDLEVTVPEEYLGDVMGDLNKKRGRIQGIDSRGAFSVVRAQVPHAEVFRYAIDLRSMTQGRGVFTLAFSHYEEVPAQVAQAVIEASAVKAGVE
jgi:elongation factor G